MHPDPETEAPEPAVISRRQFLHTASAAALIAALHPRGAGARSGPAASNGEPLLLGLRLLTAEPLASMKAFYHGSLGFPVLEETPDLLTVVGGTTPITFVAADREQHGPEHGEPWYHVAFNIPENKLRLAREWQLERTELIPTPKRQQDPAFPSDVRHFPNWNAHSVFFWDPAGNLLEYIARHDLDNRASGPFTSNDILYASEIAFVVDDQPATARQLNRDLGLGVYPPDAGFWWAMGDELGLLLCIPERRWGENTATPKRFAVFPTEATIRGAGRRTYSVPGYPYTVNVSPSS
ncbi:MAG: hypothetical protein MI919_20445, partial [Holophagales bacterium]|nr:hypothetical protein [Holophagales bacterium]